LVNSFLLSLSISFCVFAIVVVIVEISSVLTHDVLICMIN